MLTRTVRMPTEIRADRTLHILENRAGVGQM